MGAILAYPFTILPGGRVATVDQDSDAGHAQQLASLIATRLGERVLVPTFGVPDPAFSTLDGNDVAAAVELFGPPVRIVSVETGPVRSGTAEVTVEFTSE